MSLLVLIIILFILFGGGWYGYGRRADWGYAPFGGIMGLILLLVILKIFGVI